jgi:tRNA(Ile2) C34 agmatinyltransferase TiaS
MTHCPICGRESFQALQSPEGEAGYGCFKCGFKAPAAELPDLFAQGEEEIAS